MDKIKIIGGAKLKGSIPICGAKNAVLPLMTASLLTDKKLVLLNTPHLVDVSNLVTLLAQHGVEISMEGNSPFDGHVGRVLSLKAANINNIVAPYDLVRKMRASILVLGPLLARTGKAKVSLPGGCAIGPRPIDLHINGLIKMGADIELKEGYITAIAKNGLKGANITMPIVSVTATENIMMAACLAKGTTKISNAALEPEVTDLANCLNSMGASIHGIGTNTLVIEGRDILKGTNHEVLPDRIETGTYAIAAAITGGELNLINTNINLISSVASVLQKIGVEVTPIKQGIKVKALTNKLDSIDITTEPYPGFPTDLQAQIMVLLSLSKKTSSINENIFENRFMHVPELCRMGANIDIKNNTAIIKSVKKLKGAEVMATDLRASVSLVIAGLVAEGETIINRIYHLDRGYERIEDKLNKCNAQIERIN